MGGVHTRVGDGLRPASTAAFRHACAWLLPFGFLHHTSAQSVFISSAENAGGGIPGLMLRDPARRAASPHLLIDRFQSMIRLVMSRSSSSVAARSKAPKAALLQEGVRLTHLTTVSCTKACQCRLCATVSAAPFPSMSTCAMKARRERLIRRIAMESSDPSRARSATALVEGAVPLALSGLQSCYARLMLAAALHATSALARHVCQASRREAVYPTLPAPSSAVARRRASYYRLDFVAQTTFLHRRNRNALAGCQSNPVTS